MQIFQILIPRLKIFPLDYANNNIQQLKVGDIVVVNFYNKETIGVVWSNNKAQVAKEKIKPIIKKTEFKLDTKHIDFIKTASKYYLMSLGSILKLVLPNDIHKTPNKIIEQNIITDINLPKLEKEQKEALQLIKNDKKVSLIHGVTSSGKTEIYYHLIKESIEKNEQSLILLPEIALTKQMIQRFESRFGFPPIIWNSSISDAKKRQILRGIINGTVKIVMGARSALFLPYNNLKLIIVDEEHDASYKQEEGTIYNARDMSVLKGKIFDAKITLLSATPSIESYYNAITNKYSYIKLQKRYNEASLPNITPIDLKKENMKYGQWISPSLQKQINNSLEENEQILLFLNRKGYAPIMLCSQCGFKFQCINCSSCLVYHKNKKSLECHLCGYCTSVKSSCPECLNENNIVPCGPGVERLYEEVTKLFPNAKTHIITKDEATKKGTLEKLINKITSNEINILIVTQIITKGYDFPDLNLVAVIDSDAAFLSPELKSAENAFQLLQQVSGRAGRRKKTGNVILQTYFPEHFLIQLLQSQNYNKFYENELKTREEANMPPFTRSCLIKIESKKDIWSYEASKIFVQKAPKIDRVKIYGPAKDNNFVINRKYRYKILFLADKKFNLQQYISFLINNVKLESKISIKIDIDSYKV